MKGAERQRLWALWYIESSGKKTPPKTCFFICFTEVEVLWRETWRRLSGNNQKDTLERVQKGCWYFILHLQGGCAIMACSLLICTPMAHVCRKGLSHWFWDFFEKKKILSATRVKAVDWREESEIPSVSCYHPKAWVFLHNRYWRITFRAILWVSIATRWILTCK